MRILGKLLISLVVLIVLVLGAAYWLVFTQSGNDMVKPYMEEEISKKIQKEVKISKFTLTPSHLSLQAKVSNEADLIIDGDIKPFSQWFDLMYHIQAQNLQTPIMLIKNKLEITGKAKGNVDKFFTKGEGKAFESHIDYNFNVLNKKPTDGYVKAKGLQVAQILELLGKPAYTSGAVDVDVNIVNQNDNLSGNANILIHENKLNAKFIKRDFNVSLPNNISFVGKIDGSVENNVLNAKSNIVSTLATIETMKTNVNLKSMDISTDYIFKVKDLGRLEFLTKKKLKGALKVIGDVKKTKDNLIVNAYSSMFDGTIAATLRNNALAAKIKDIQIRKIFHLISEPAMAHGLINLTANINDVKAKDKKIDIDLKVRNGELVGSQMISRFDLQFPPITTFSVDLNGKLVSNVFNAKSDIKTSLATLKTQKTSFDIKSQNFSTDYNVNLLDLAKISKIIKQDLRGNLKANGDISKQGKAMSFSAHTKSLGGNIDASFKDDKLEANLQNISLNKILYIVKKPNFIEGNINAKAKIEHATQGNISGNVDLTLENGFLLGAGLKELSEVNFPARTPIAMKSKVNIQNGLAKFTNSIKSSLASLSKFDGSYDINSGFLDSSYSVDIKELASLAFVTKQVFHGPFNANGIAKMNVLTKKNVKIVANASILGGVSKSVFENDQLVSYAKGIATKGLCKMLDYPYVFDSNGDFNLKYNVKSKQGKYDLLMKEGHLMPNKLTNLVQTFSGYDMTREVYKDTLLRGVIDNDMATYLLDMNGTSTTLKIPDGTVNLLTKQTQANAYLQFQKTDLHAQISGNVNSPKVKIKGSKYLENKAIKAIDKHLKGKDKKIVKDILKLF